MRGLKRASVACVLTVLAAAIAVVPSAPAHAAITNCLGQTPTITGDGGDNTISGTRGNDVIFAGAGNDTVNGIGGNDVICGGAGNDHIDGGPGSDTIAGDAGDDLLTGSTDVDTVNYASETGAVVVQLALAHTDAADGSDTLSGFENVVGSRFDDTIRGSDDANQLLGLAGNDLIGGRLGNDLIDGGADVDTVSFDAISVSVNASLELGTATGSQGSKVLVALENLTGSKVTDELHGDAGPNTIIGLGGLDTIDAGDGDDTIDPGGNHDFVAGEGGDDRVVVSSLDGDDIDGGVDGVDTVDFSGLSPLVVNANLLTGQVTGSTGAAVIADFENVVGTEGNDTITGDAGANRLDGRGGNDSIDGGEGNDKLIGGDDNDELFGDAGKDSLDGGNDDDQLEGGSGKDTAAFASEALAPVSVNLADGTASGQGIDLLTTRENVLGSAKGDVLIGDAKKNVINGGAGDDTCDGNGGNDKLISCP